MTRNELRRLSADYLNSLDRETLFNRFEITRIANITGLDVIGVPIYSSIRPAGKVVSVNAGKSSDPKAARAGAIAEAIEFYTFENPRDDDHRFWLRPRVIDPDWLHSSNGQALGSCFEDAFLQALYEVIERDQVTLWRISLKRLAIHPPRVALPGLSDSIHLRVQSASLKLYLLYCTIDIQIPVYWAILCDPGWTSFSGYGCHLDQNVAAERAVLEAIQSRCVYIAGARDDIARRDYELTQHRDHNQIIREMDSLQVQSFPVQASDKALSLADELKIVLNRLNAWQDKIRYKHINLGDFHAVKVIVEGFEQPMVGNKWKEQRWTQLRESFMPARLCMESNWKDCVLSL